MSQKIDLPTQLIDPSPFQLVEMTSLTKVFYRLSFTPFFPLSLSSPCTIVIIIFDLFLLKGS